MRRFIKSKDSQRTFLSLYFECKMNLNDVFAKLTGKTYSIMFDKVMAIYRKNITFFHILSLCNKTGNNLFMI